MSKTELGASVRDEISGVVGVIVARTEWLYRTPEVALARDGCDADARPWDLMWIDEGRVSAVEGEA